MTVFVVFFRRPEQKSWRFARAYATKDAAQRYVRQLATVGTLAQIKEVSAPAV